MSSIFQKFSVIFLSKKYYLLYAATAQIILLLVNVISLVTNNRDMYYNDILYFIIPNVFYVLFVVMFYATYLKMKLGKIGTKLAVSAIITIITANVIHLLICVVNMQISYELYFLDAAIIQVINAFFMSIFIISDVTPLTTGIQLVIFKLLVYAAVISNVVALVYCLDNPYIMVYAMIFSSILLFLCYMVYHNHSLAVKPTKTLNRKKVRVEKRKEDADSI